MGASQLVFKMLKLLLPIHQLPKNTHFVQQAQEQDREEFHIECFGVLYPCCRQTNRNHPTSQFPT